MGTMKITLTEANGAEHDITESVAFMYDAIIQSLDWGSGFLDLEEQLHIASVGVLAGYQVPEVIPLEDYPPPDPLDFFHGKPHWKRTKEEREAFYAAYKEWEVGYGKRAREVILAKLRVFDMVDEDEGEGVVQSPEK